MNICGSKSQRCIEPDLGTEPLLKPREGGFAELEEKIDLETLPLFNSIPPKKREELSGLLEFRRCAAGEVAVHQGDVGDGFFIIVSGRLEVTAELDDGQPLYLDTLTDGDWFGEMALVEQTRRTATVRAIQTALMLFLSSENFTKMQNVAPEVFETDLYKKISRRRVANTLKVIPLFSSFRRKEVGPLQKFDDKRLEEIGDLFEMVQYEPQQDIFTIGDIGDSFFFISRGEVDVFAHDDNDNEIQVDHLTKHEWFGEISLVESSRRTATVRTVGPTLCLELHTEEFATFQDLAPELAATIESVIAIRKSKALQKIPFFQGVIENKPWSKIALLGELFKYEDYDEGHPVFEQGDKGDSFYLLIEGHVTVLLEEDSKQVVIDEHGPGSFFGEIALLCNTVRTATVRCDEYCRFLVLSADRFKKFLQIVPELHETVNFLLETRTANSLRNIDFFKGIKENKPWNKLDIIGSLLKYETHDAYEVVFDAGEEGDKFYFVAQGKAESISEEGIHLNYLARGEYFGEMALIEETERTATIRTVENCVFLTLSRDDFNSFLQIAPELKPHITRLIEKRHENIFQRTGRDSGLYRQRQPDDDELKLDEPVVVG